MHEPGADGDINDSQHSQPLDHISGGHDFRDDASNPLK